MTNEDIIRLAKEAGLNYRENVNEIWSDFCDGIYIDDLKLFAGLVIANHQPRSTMTWQEGYDVGVAAEREECAAIANEYHGIVADTIYDRITERGQE